MATETGSVYNLAAQIWNHTFYWNSLKPNGGGLPSETLMAKIVSDFGSYETFQSQFNDIAGAHFGSGWAWLVLDSSKKLKVVGTHDAENPLKDGSVPLMTCDVWEHAYYIDYRNDRLTYLKNFWSVVNWEWAESQLANAN